MLEKWKMCNDRNKTIGALLTDLSKAFDCLSHELLIAKLHAYGFDMNSLRLVHSYLTNRYQRTKIKGSYSSWMEIIFGVPQGSVLGPLLFNIFLCDLFFSIENVEFASFADDTTPFVTGDCLTDVISSLEKTAADLLKWFETNRMVANPEKCQLITNKKTNVTLNVGESKISNSSSVKLLGIQIDYQLTFREHINVICNKANNKMHALARISPFLDFDKKRTLFNAFFESQFSYCPLTWMLHNRELNNRINRIQEKCLRIIFNDYSLTFQELLQKNKTDCIHQRNLKSLCIEIYKVKNNLSPEIFSNTFQVKAAGKYNLRNNDTFLVPKVKSVFNGTESLSFLGPKLWNSLPDELKNKDSICSFKSAIKQLQIICPCRICKDFVAGVGFVDFAKPI